jgi:hypothetical protein
LSRNRELYPFGYERSHASPLASRAVPGKRKRVEDVRNIKEKKVSGRHLLLGLAWLLPGAVQGEVITVHHKGTVPWGSIPGEVVIKGTYSFDSEAGAIASAPTYAIYRILSHEAVIGGVLKN